MGFSGPFPPLATQASFPGSSAFPYYAPAAGAGATGSAASLLSETSSEGWGALPQAQALQAQAQAAGGIPPRVDTAISSTTVSSQLRSVSPASRLRPLGHTEAGSSDSACVPAACGGVPGGCPSGSGAGGEQLLQRPECITKLQRQMLHLPPADQAALVQRMASRGAEIDDPTAATHTVEAQPVARRLLATAAATAAQALAQPAPAAVPCETDRDARALRWFVETCPPEVVAAIFLPLPAVRDVWARLGQLVTATAATAATTAVTAAAALQHVAAPGPAPQGSAQAHVGQVDGAAAAAAAAVHAAQPARLMLAAAANSAAGTPSTACPYTSVA
jgi:hypothetical protein